MTAVKPNEQWGITDVSVLGDTAYVDIWYPGIAPDRPTYLQVGLVAVRAADGVRLNYDFDRDGFVVCQPCEHLKKVGPNSYKDETEWVEVGFFQSWKFNDRDDGTPSQEEFAAADAEYEGGA